MAQKRREESGEGTLRIATIIEQRQIRAMEGAAVMAAHNLKPSDRIEPERFLQMIEEWQRAPVRGN